LYPNFWNWFETAADDGPYGSEFPWTLDSVDPWHLAAGVAHITGISLNEILGSLFEAHPNLPKSFVPPEHLSAHPLNSFEMVVAYGVECNTCLQLHRYALRYMSDGVALFGIRSGSEAVGTIAFQFDVSEDNPRVQVQEITTKDNADYGFCRLVRSLEKRSMRTRKSPPGSPTRNSVLNGGGAPLPLHDSDHNKCGATDHHATSQARRIARTQIGFRAQLAFSVLEANLKLAR
jgi:hypothetical protein